LGIATFTTATVNQDSQMQISVAEYNEATGVAYAAGVNAAVAELDAVLAAELPTAMNKAFENGKASASKAAPKRGTRPAYPKRSERKPTLRPVAN
jgi:hypothetical protein